MKRDADCDWRTATVDRSRAEHSRRDALPQMCEGAVIFEDGQRARANEIPPGCDQPNWNHGAEKRRSRHRGSHGGENTNSAGARRRHHDPEPVRIAEAEDASAERVRRLSIEHHSCFLRPCRDVVDRLRRRYLDRESLALDSIGSFGAIVLTKENSYGSGAK